MTQSSVTERLAAEVVGLSRDRLPKGSLDSARKLVLDTVGVALTGATTPEGRRAAQFREEVVGIGTSLAWGERRRIRSDLAVFANAVSAHVLDYDDTMTHAGVHAGSIVVPLALALGEEGQSSVEDVLAAVVCGYQVAGLIGEPTFGRFVVSASATLGLLSGTSVVARMRGLDAEQTSHALGLAASLGGSTNEYLASGGDSEFIQHGWAARSALTAVDLAAAGAVGPRRIVDGDFGIIRALAPSAEVTAESLGEDLWDRTHIESSSIKPYPVCHSIVPVATSWLKVLDRLRADGVDPFAEVATVTCVVPDYAIRYMLDPIEPKRRPSSSHQARFSLPWCLGKLALDGKLDLRSFAPACLTHPKILALAERVTWVEHPRQGAPALLEGGVRVELLDGRRYDEFEVGHKGGPTNPMTTDEIHAKFVDCAAAAGRSEGARAAIAAWEESPVTGPVTGFIDVLARLGLPGRSGTNER